MTGIPFYLIEAVANDDGLFVAVSNWRTVEFDVDSDVPMMAGGHEVGVEAEDKPDFYQRFDPITFMVQGELALYRMLDKVAALAELDAQSTQLWIDSIMIRLNELTTTEA